MGLSLPTVPGRVPVGGLPAACQHGVCRMMPVTDLLQCLPRSGQVGGTLWVGCRDLKRSIDELFHVMAHSDFSSIPAVLPDDGSLVRDVLQPMDEPDVVVSTRTSGNIKQPILRSRPEHFPFLGDWTQSSKHEDRNPRHRGVVDGLAHGKSATIHVYNHTLLKMVSERLQSEGSRGIHTGIPVTWANPRAIDRPTISDGHVMMVGIRLDLSETHQHSQQR